MDGMNPLEEVERLNREFERKFEKLLCVSEQMRKDSVHLIADKSRTFINVTTEFVVQILQKEIMNVLRQQLIYK